MIFFLTHDLITLCSKYACPQDVCITYDRNSAKRNPLEVLSLVLNSCGKVEFGSFKLLIYDWPLKIHLTLVFLKNLFWIWYFGGGRVKIFF